MNEEIEQVVACEASIIDISAVELPHNEGIMLNLYEETGVACEASINDISNVELPREECIKVEEEKVIFVADDIYKSVETFKEQIPGLPEYVYWILFLRYNRNIISEDEVRFAEETICKLRNAMKEENSYFQKLFEDNSGNTIDCSPIQNEIL